MRDEEFDAMMDRLGPAAQARVLKAMTPDTETAEDNEPYAAKRKKASASTRGHFLYQGMIGGALLTALSIICFVAALAGIIPILLPLSTTVFILSAWILSRWFLWVFGLNKKEWK